MNGDGVSRRKLVQLAEVVDHLLILESDGHALVGEVDHLYPPHVAVEDILVIVVLHLNDLVPDTEIPSELLDLGPSRPSGVEEDLQSPVHLPGPQRAAMHGTEHLDVLDGVDTQPSGDPLLYKLRHQPGNLLRIFPLQEIEVRVGRGSRDRGRRLAAIDLVRGGDDPAVSRLAKDFFQPDHRHHPAGDHMVQSHPRPDRGKLVHVSNQNQRPVGGMGRQQLAHERNIQHGTLVDHQQVALQGIAPVPGESTAGRNDLQQTVDGLGLQSGGLGKPLGGPAGGCAQQAFHLLGSENHQDRVHQGGLAHSGSTRNHQDPVPQGLGQGLFLTFRQGRARPPLAPGSGLFDVDRRIVGGTPGQLPDPGRYDLFGACQVRQKDQVFPVEAFPQQLSSSDHPVQGLVHDGFGDFKDLHGLLAELPVGKRTVAGLGRFQQYMVETGPRPQGGVPRDSDIPGNLVGRLEPDTRDVLAQPVGIFPDLGDGIGPIGFVDPGRPPGSDTVRVKEKHDFPDRLLIRPGLSDAPPAAGTDALHGFQAGRMLLDDFKDLLAEFLHQLAGVDRSNALDHAAGQVPFYAFSGRGRETSELARLELAPVILVDDPGAFGAEPLPGVDDRRRAHHRHQVPLPLDLDLKHAEPVFLIEEGYSLNSALDSVGSRRG